jgi:hypothetical protein
MNKFILDVTYDIVSPKSAEQGDFEESGFEAQDLEFDSLPELALYIAERGPVEGSGSYYTVDPDIDYTNSHRTYYGFHIKLLLEQQKELDKLLRLSEKELRKLL